MHRILYVDAAPFAGGAQQSLAVLVHSLDRTRFEPYLAGPALLGTMNPGVPYLHLELPQPRGGMGASVFLAGSAAAGIRLTAMVRRVHPAIVHANGRGSWLPSWIACRLTGTPLLWHARDLVGPLAFDRMAAFGSTVCLVPSEATRHRLTGGNGVFRRLEHRLRVIPNGVDTCRFRPVDRRECRERFALPQDCIIVGMIGQWATWKRVDLFLGAARIAAEQDSQLFFVLCGAPPPGEGAGLADGYAQALSNKGVVLPWTAEMPQLLNALDILAHPASGEAFGRVVVEAMACGVPVIATRAGGTAETVIDGETGLLVEPGSRDDLARAILALARDGDRRRAMGLNGRQRVEEQFSATAHAARVQDEYERLAACP